MCRLFAGVKPVSALRVRLVRMRQQIFSSTSHAHTSHKHDLSPFLSLPVLQRCVAALSLLISTPPATWTLLFFCVQTYYVVYLSRRPSFCLLLYALSLVCCISLAHTYMTLLLLRACKTTCRFMHNRTHEQCCCCSSCCFVVLIYSSTLIP